MDTQTIGMSRRSLAVGLGLALLAGVPAIWGRPAGPGGATESGLKDEIQRMTLRAAPLLDAVGDVRSRRERELWTGQLSGLLTEIISKERRLQRMQARGLR